MPTNQNSTPVQPATGGGILADLQAQIKASAPTPASQPANTESSQGGGLLEALKRGSIQNTAENNGPIQIQDQRVIEFKYKLYAFVLAALCYLGRGYVQTAWTDYNQKVIDIDRVRTEIATLKTQTDTFNREKNLIAKIGQRKEEIITAINSNKIDTLKDPELVNNINFIKSFLQIGELEAPKMVIDEKKILTNMNLFLLSSDPLNKDVTRNGILKSITIGKPKEALPNLYEVPVTATISFANSTNLLKFIDNVEKHVAPESLGILYKIDSISYDMVRYNQSQEVNMSLKAYYFK